MNKTIHTNKASINLLAEFHREQATIAVRVQLAQLDTNHGPIWTDLKDRRTAYNMV